MKNSKPAANAFTALMTAAMTLPIIAIPLCSAAEEVATANASSATTPSSSLLPVGAVFGVRTLYYRETGDRMKVTEPVVWIKSPIGETWEVSASATLDIVSGASAIFVSNQTGKPVQIYTGASITDHRKAGDVALKHRWGESTLSVSRTQSAEKDYRSDATGVNATYDFNERNTTLAAGYGNSNDRVRSVTDQSLNARRESREYLFGVTQLVDRFSLVQSNLTYTRASGYLNDPYRLTIAFFPTGPRVSIVADTRPDSRTQWTWLTRYKRTLQVQQAVVSAEYRYYRDDWGMRSHTVAASWLQTLNEQWKVELGLRYYAQSKANFYRPVIESRPLPVYTSSDQRLASFGSLEPSLKAIYQLNDADSFDLGASLYRQQGNWKLGGGGTATFEPLQALLLNAGYTHRF